MFMYHFFFICLICTIGSLALLRILLVAVKKGFTVEKLLFGCVFLLYSFSYYDFHVMWLPIVDRAFLGIHLEFEAMPQVLYYQCCIISLGIALVFALYAMKWMLGMVRAPGNIKRWQLISILGFLLLLIISTVQSATLYSLEGYVVAISQNWIVGIFSGLMSFVLVFFTVNLKFFPFLKRQAILLNIKRWKNVVYGILVNAVMILYSGGFAIRIFFGITWDNILFADLFFLASTIAALILGFFAGFGESLLCVRNMESIYIVHQSGKLIYTRKFFPESAFDEEFFGAFLIIINEITKEIRSAGGKISQIVLEDDSEVIMWKGEFIQGVLITKTYNPLFIKKLRDLVAKIEGNIGSDLKCWNGEHLELSQQINAMIRDLF